MTKVVKRTRCKGRNGKDSDESRLRLSSDNRRVRMRHRREKQVHSGTICGMPHHATVRKPDLEGNCVQFLVTFNLYSRYYDCSTIDGWCGATSDTPLLSSGSQMSFMPTCASRCTNVSLDSILWLFSRVQHISNMIGRHLQILPQPH